MKQYKSVVWLDDTKNPADYGYKDAIWIKSHNQLMIHIVLNGLPQLICFDYDLGHNKRTGYDSAKFIIDYCCQHNYNLPDWITQSKNVTGNKQINDLLNTYKSLIYTTNQVGGVNEKG